mgnify:CR=1 FL=1
MKTTSYEVKCKQCGAPLPDDSPVCEYCNTLSLRNKALFGLKHFYKNTCENFLFFDNKTKRYDERLNNRIGYVITYQK